MPGVDTQIAAFYKLENLFDTVDDPDKEGDDFLPGSLWDWSEYRYLEKLENITRSMVFLNQERLPAIIGVSEIENKTVLTDLVNQSAFMRDDAVHFFVNHWPSRLTVHFDKTLYRPNRSYSGNIYHGGFSDHLPVFVPMDLP